MDSELLATQRIMKILARLDLEQRESVLQFASRRVSQDRMAQDRDEREAYFARQRETPSDDALSMTLAAQGARKGY